MSQSNDLFHASCKLYEVGTILKRDKPTMYSIQQRKIGNGWIDEKLNEIKPRNAPLRDFTYYACDSAANCVAYKSKCENGEFSFVYRVNMKDPIRAPMCLIDLILKIGIDSEILIEVISEYWNPTQDWKYYEYLSQEMIIVELIKYPNSKDIGGGKFRYNSDVERRNQFFKLK